MPRTAVAQKCVGLLARAATSLQRPELLLQTSCLSTLSSPFIPKPAVPTATPANQPCNCMGCGRVLCTCSCRGCGRALCSCKRSYSSASKSTLAQAAASHEARSASNNLAQRHAEVSGMHEGAHSTMPYSLSHACHQLQHLINQRP